MGAAENLIGHELLGRKKKKWTVVERLHRDHRDSSDGIFFSVGYKVRAENGALAFMKATEISLLTENDATMFQRMEAAMQQHGIEIKMLEHCRGNNMDRVVIALDFGETMIEHAGAREPVFFIFFDLAECDVRVQVDKRTRFDLFWIYGALHDLAVAIQQLHAGKITHNDIKPPNLLVFLRELQFKERIQMLADLGCATSPLIASIYDDAICAGDPRYAAPELMYAKNSDSVLQTFDARRRVDIFHLGCMIFFLVTGRMLTTEVIRHLPPEQRPPDNESDWVGQFTEVLPYWRDAFGRVLIEFKSKLPKNADGKLSSTAEKLLDALVQLSEPDPSLRGHPSNRAGQADPLSVQQYISLFNGLRRTAMH